jgi:hypothetical protein
MNSTVGYAAAAALALLVACGDDTTSGAGAAASGNVGGSQGGAPMGGSGGSGAAGGDVSGEPGTLTISVSGLTGADGKVVIASLLDGGEKLAGTCMTIASGSATQVAAQVDAIDVCELGDDVELPGGALSLRAGLYTEGTPAPEGCLAIDVVVDGDTEFELPAFGTCN